MKPVAYFHSPFTTKFGIPRQSGVVNGVEGDIVLCPPYDALEAVRGIEGFSHLWLIWGFSANKPQTTALTVRPPLLGGNERMGVFATRSPFRPNGLGLSSVRLIATRLGRLTVAGADLMDGTPIYDIKPYLAFTDSHPDATGGFTTGHEWPRLEVAVPDTIRGRLTAAELQGIVAALEQDPRPRYHDDAERIYGMPYGTHDVHFRVNGNIAEIVSLD